MSQLARKELRTFIIWLIINVSGYTALHDACYYGFEDIADELCRRGAKIDSYDKDGKTPLHVRFVLLTLNGPITTAADDKFVTSFPIFDKNKV